MLAIGLTWLLLMTTALVTPFFISSASMQWFHVNLTIDIALVYYVAAIAAMLLKSPDQRRIRLTWTLAWLAYVVHVLLAFHHAHGWSHTHAMEHTRQESGWAEGIFVSHFFTLLWSADVLWWWASPRSYLTRPVIASAAIHAFMAFIIFNGAVIFEKGPVRWFGVAATISLVIIAARGLASSTR